MNTIPANVPGKPSDDDEESACAHRTVESSVAEILRPENKVESDRPPHLFRKGESGNPGGRPKVEGHVRELARRQGPRAIRRLTELMQSPNERVAVAACQALLDRGYGKAPISLVGQSGPLVSINLASGSLTPEQAYATICGDPSVDIGAVLSRVEHATETVK